jgi:putative toxin-antitoxin system antitoxin component (TIGR02293 family)
MSHVAEEVGRYLGGRRVLTRSIASDFDLASLVQEQVPVDAAQAVLDAGLLTPEELHALVIPRRTLTKRRSTTGRLTTEESDHLVRVVRTLALAVECFQNTEKAANWLRRPNRALGAARPIDLLATDSGTRLVEDVLGRINYGVYS